MAGNPATPHVSCRGRSSCPPTPRNSLAIIFDAGEGKPFAFPRSCVKFLCATRYCRSTIQLERPFPPESRLPRRAVTERAGAKRNQVRPRCRSVSRRAIQRALRAIQNPAQHVPGWIPVLVVKHVEQGRFGGDYEILRKAVPDSAGLQAPRQVEIC